MQHFQFGNVVVVDKNQIGVIVKSWQDGSHDVYVRSLNFIRSYHADEIVHYIYNKELTKSELKYYDR